LTSEPLPACDRLCRSIFPGPPSASTTISFPRQRLGANRNNRSDTHSSTHQTGYGLLVFPSRSPFHFTAPLNVI